jgi:hypothetical protein
MNINGSIGNHIYNAGVKRQKTPVEDKSTTQDVLPNKSQKSSVTAAKAADSGAFESNFEEAFAKVKLRVVNPQAIRHMSKAEVDTKLANARLGEKVDFVDPSKIIVG